jgi:hypothetical protein
MPKTEDCWRAKVAVALLFSLVASCPGRLLAEAPRGSQASACERSGGPYCGLYCVYGALLSEGVRVRFEELLQTSTLGRSQEAVWVS